MSSTPHRTHRVRLFNGQFDAVTLDECVDQVFADIDQGRTGWLATVNVAILMMMRDSATLQSFVDRARWTVADGQPLIWASRWFNRQLPERVTGVDLVDCLCEKARARQEGVYCLGATQNVLDQMVARLRQQHPGLVVNGSDGYFSLDQFPERAQLVAASGAKILLVGMGVPRQEKFIEEQWANLGVNLAVGVGGSFDVMAGLRRRAPVWMQKIGLEWVYRLIQEPGRLWKRYLVTGLQFGALSLRAWVFPSYRDR
jgi:N-acetylglucosaminyldiphosphoundecaprenol N-acetyl-beta-D-mannosaminyltransferase